MAINKIGQLYPLSQFAKLPWVKQDYELNLMRRALTVLQDQVTASGSASVGLGVLNSSGGTIEQYAIMGYDVSGGMAKSKSGPVSTTYVPPVYFVQKTTGAGEIFYPNTGGLVYVRVTGSWSIGGVAWLSETAGTASASRPASASVAIPLGIFANEANGDSLALVRLNVSLLGQVG